MKSQLKNIRNFLCKLSGEDFAIIKECSRKIQLYFSVIGFFVLLILLCCFLSALNFTDHLFHNPIADIGVGLLWGYIVTNLYVLLLYTISPTLLPNKERKKSKIKTQSIRFSFSMLLRIGLVIILAMITAQPLIVFVLNPETEAFANEIRILLANNPLAWIITIFVIGLFLLPIYLKYSIRKLGEFYEKKANIEKLIVDEDYDIFKNKYKNLLELKISEYNKAAWLNLIPYLEKLKEINKDSYIKHFSEIKEELIDEKISKYEYWNDPPYRTILKSNTQNRLSEKDLLNHIYPELD